MAVLNRMIDWCGEATMVFGAVSLRTSLSVVNIAT